MLLTTNGGFSWLPQNLVSNVTGKATGPLPMLGSPASLPTSNYFAPLLTGVYFNRNKNVNSSVRACVCVRCLFLPYCIASPKPRVDNWRRLLRALYRSGSWASRRTTP